MTKSVLLALTLIAFTSCSDNSGEKQPVNRLTGKWHATLAGSKQLVWVVDKQRIRMTLVDQKRNTFYRLDTEKDPLEIDIITEKDTLKGIIEFAGKDAFRIHVPARFSDPRPVSFPVSSDDQSGMLKFTRFK